jgi:hypothetical protein
MRRGTGIVNYKLHYQNKVAVALTWHIMHISTVRDYDKIYWPCPAVKCDVQMFIIEASVARSSTDIKPVSPNAAGVAIH